MKKDLTSMHDEIKRFYVNGTTDNNAQTREEVLREMEANMRDEGYVPCLDLDPHYTVEYIRDEECFNFEASVYGVWIGKEFAWHVSGVSNGKRIPKHTHLLR